MTPRQPVRLKRGQTVIVDAGRGAQIEVERMESGAVEVRNANTSAVLRKFSPKEARG
jgi:hypothetical protein